MKKYLFVLFGLCMIFFCEDLFELILIDIILDVFVFEDEGLVDVFVSDLYN